METQVQRWSAKRKVKLLLSLVKVQGGEQLENNPAGGGRFSIIAWYRETSQVSSLPYLSV